MTTAKTLPAANYSADQVTTIVTAYKNGDSLETIAASVGKSVPSVRAKLAALKVYVSKSKTSPTGEKVTKENKEGLKSKLESLLGVELLNVEAASKQTLLALINAIVSRDEKIASLIADVLGDETSDSNEV